MKYCSKCGAPADNGAVFCSACGERFAALTVQNQSQPYQSYQFANPSGNPAQSALSLLKKHGSSALFFSTICVYAAMLVFTLINIFNPHSFIIKFFDYISQTVQENSSNDVGNIFSDLTNSVYIWQIMGGIISIAMPVLIGVGMFLTYLSSKNKSHTGIKTTGLSIIKVVVTIQLVLFCVVIGITFLIFIIAMIASASTYGTDGAAVVAGILFIIIFLGGSAAFVIIYYAKILSSIKSVVLTVETGNISKKVSIFVPVVNIIEAIAALFSFVFLMTFMPVYTNLINSAIADQYNNSYYGYFNFPYGYGDSAPVIPQFPGIDAITAVTVLLSAAFLIMISIVIFKYRDAIAKLTYSRYMPYTANSANMPTVQNSQPFSYQENPPQIAQTQQQTIQLQQPQNNSPFVPPEDNDNNKSGD